MNTNTYWPRIFEVVDGTPVPLAVPRNGYSTRMEAKTIIEAHRDHDNCWDADENLEIFATKEGIGFRHEVPAGYSSYTYDPEVTVKFYKGASLEWFLSQGLDEDQRDMLDQTDLLDLRETIDLLQGEGHGQKTSTD